VIDKTVIVTVINNRLNWYDIFEKYSEKIRRDGITNEIQTRSCNLEFFNRVARKIIIKV
jgi:hypothetical protein